MSKTHHRAAPMSGLPRERYLAHARRPAYRRHLAEAEGVVADALDLARHPVVAFSCGKDSAVLAHMVASMRSDVPLRFLSWGETRILHDVDGVLTWFRAQGWQVEEIHTDRVFSPGWETSSWQEQRDSQRDDRQQSTADGVDLLFLGLRAEESRIRHLSLLIRDITPGLPLHCYRYRSGARVGTVRSCPLARWTTDDVGAYLATHGIPLLEDYHDRGLEARTTARVTERTIGYYQLSHLKRYQPDRFRALVARFPELRVYA